MAFFLNLTGEAVSWTPEAKAEAKEAAIKTLHLTGKSKTSRTNEFTRLEKCLQKGATKKVIKKADIPSIIDQAALAGVDLNDIEATLKHVCKERNLSYTPSVWGVSQNKPESKTECFGEVSSVPRDIAEAKVKAALVIVNKIGKEFTNIKAIGKPPKPLTLTLDAVYILISGKKPDKSGKPGVPIEARSLSLLVSGQNVFKKKIDAFDKDKVTKKTIRFLQPILDDPDFKPGVVKRAMKCLHGPCLWVRAVHAYCMAKDLEKSFTKTIA